MKRQAPVIVERSTRHRNPVARAMLTSAVFRPKSELNKRRASRYKGAASDGI